MDVVKERKTTGHGSGSGNGDGVDVFQVIRDRVSLSDYFTKILGTDLHHAAAGRYKCLCPFHQESTPSCEITEDHAGRNGRFRCWGCNAQGSVIDAVMEKQHFEQPMDAVKWLDREYKLNLPLGGRVNAQARSQRQRRVDAAEAAAKRSEDILWDAASKVGGQGRKTLRGRGLGEQTIRAFGLGVTVGEKSGPRITIPIRDAHGDTLTITRRAMFDSFTCPSCETKTDAKMIATRAKEGNGRECPGCGQKTIWKLMATQAPKYLNESTSVSGVEKSKLLYNEAAATERFLDGKLGEPLIVTEGYGDVWAAHEAGQKAAVAYSGGVLSNAQAERLVQLGQRGMRVGKNPHKYILLVPDFDETGRDAVTKNLNILQKAAAALEEAGHTGAATSMASGIVVRVLTGLDDYDLTDADGHPRRCKDLGELLQAHGAGAVKQLLAKSTVSPAEWRIRAMLDNKRYTRDAQIAGVGQILNSTPYALSLSHLTAILAAHWGLAEEDVRQFLYTEGLCGQTNGRLAKAEQLVKAQRQVLTDEKLTPDQKLRRLERLISGRGRR